MQEILIAIVLGIIVGCSDILSYKKRFWLNHFSTACLFVMLCCLGAKIGCDRELLSKLDLLGTKSAVIAIFVIAGSALMLKLVTKIFDKTIVQIDGSDTE